MGSNPAKRATFCSFKRYSVDLYNLVHRTDFQASAIMIGWKRFDFGGG